MRVRLRGYCSFGGRSLRAVDAIGALGGGEAKAATFLALTRLSVALGVKAVEAGYSALFLTLETLMTRLVKAQHENGLERALKQLVYPKVLIIDEIDYLPLSREEASLFFRLVVRLYERASLIVTSNKSFDEFHRRLVGLVVREEDVVFGRIDYSR